MNTCDIDKLRDLVRRQHYAKNMQYDERYGYGGVYGVPILPEVDVERQVNTYLAAGTTVAALTKCVEALEQEGKERVKGQREKTDERRRKERILRVCRAAQAYDEGRKKAKLNFYEGGGPDLTREIELTIKEIGDPYA